MSVIGSCCCIVLLLKIFKTSLFAFLYLWMFSGPEVTYRHSYGSLWHSKILDIEEQPKLRLAH